MGGSKEEELLQGSMKRVTKFGDTGVDHRPFGHQIGFFLPPWDTNYSLLPELHCFQDIQLAFLSKKVRTEKKAHCLE